MRLLTPYVLHRGPGNGTQRGIPRINWAHPLAQGLNFYVYDVGGVHIDLVQGGTGSVITNSTRNSIGTYQNGSGISFGGVSTDDGIKLPTSAGALLAVKTLPWSAFCGTYYTGQPQGTNVAVTAPPDTSGFQGIGFRAAGFTDHFQYVFNFGSAGANQFDYNTRTAPNTFQTWGSVPTGATTANLYANGKLDQACTGLTSTTYTFAAATAGVVLNDENSANPNNNGGIKGFIPFFASWARSLSAQDALQLHLDPYCFLIFPQDEMWARRVGVSAGAATSASYVFGTSQGNTPFPRRMIGY